MGGTQFVMTNKAKDQVAIMRWLDAHFEPRTSIELFLGTVGTTLVDKGSILDYAPNPPGSSYNEFRYGNCPVHVPLIIAGDDWGKTVAVMAEDVVRLGWLRNTLRPYINTYSIYGYATADEAKWILSQGNDIRDYFIPIEAKWITQGGIDQEHASVMARLKAMGIDEYIKIMQAQIDRFAQYSK